MPPREMLICTMVPVTLRLHANTTALPRPFAKHPSRAGEKTHVVADHVPLVGVSLNSREDGVNVIVGERPDQNYEHNISGPGSIAVENDNCLVIRCNDGSVTRVCCTCHHEQS